MAEISTQAAQDSAKGVKSRLIGLYGLIVGTYILATSFTDAFNLADSVGYAGSGSKLKAFRVRSLAMEATRMGLAESVSTCDQLVRRAGPAGKC